jgi:hypothetical protein
LSQAIQLFTQQSGGTVTGNSGDLNAFDADSLDLHFNITAVTGSLQVLVETKGLDGIYYTIYDSTALSATGATSKSIGPGLELAKSFGDVIRVRWVVVTGPVTASIVLTGRKAARGPR